MKQKDKSWECKKVAIADLQSGNELVIIPECWQLCQKSSKPKTKRKEMAKGVFSASFTELIKTIMKTKEKLSSIYIICSWMWIAQIIMGSYIVPNFKGAKTNQR